MTNPFDLAATILSPDAGHDPVQWINKRLNGHTWSKQEEVVRSVKEHKRTAVAACHAVGKSWIAAAVICEWLENHQPGQAFVVTTAPSYAQVRAILWRYINQFHSRNNLRGRCNQVEWFMGGELVAIGRKPADTDEDAFQGIHAPYVLAVLDEAGGVPAQFWNAVESVTTSDECRILAIGNPDHPQSPFREAFESEQWNSIRISAFDNPNFTGEPCPIDVKKNLVTPTWVEEAKNRWGETSPVYQSKVLGLFPDTTEDSVISYAHLVAAINREPPEKVNEEATILGIDVAGGGSDMTVVRQRRGNQALKQWTTSLSDSADLTNWILKIIAETSAKVVRIDSTGIGWGIVGSLREKAEGTMIIGINASSKPSQSRFLNARAEMWWSGRTIVEKGELDLSQAVDADNLLAQLSAPKWELVAANGKIKIESKDDIRKRIGRSPDNADALLLAFYDRFGGVQEEGISLAKVNLTDLAAARAVRGLQRNPATQLPTVRRIGLNRWR